MADNKAKDNAVRTMLKEAGILLAITLIAGLVLGFVNELTKEPIRLQEEKAIQEACASVFPTATRFEEAACEISQQVTEELNQNGVKAGTVYRALDSSDAGLGYVIETTSTQGYGGNIVIYTGLSQDGTVQGISFLEISETAGLGMEAESVLGPQFRNVKADLFTYTKTGSRSESEIDAISGATITTRAVVNAVNGALTIGKELGVGGDGNE